MLLLGVDSVQAGMTLARPVLHPDRSDLLLLAKGFDLDDSIIALLRQQGITHVWITFPGLEELDERISEDVARSHMELYRVLDESIDRLEHRVELKVDVQRYRKAVHHMLADIVAHANHDVIMHQLRACGTRLTGHQANCAYLALLVGAHLGGYLRAERRTLQSDVAENTAQLGLGALLHDVGKAGLDSKMRDTCILDDESRWEEYRSHTARGFEIVREQISPVAAHVVYHHHQRYDGGGFPSVKTAMSSETTPLMGNKIHVFCRIVAAVNVLDHLLSPRGTNDLVPTIVAMSQLCSDRFKGWFDPVIIEAIRRLIPPFMTGQIVRLSDGAEAVVVENRFDAPTRPSVKILTGPIHRRSTRVRKRPIDLRAARSLYIVEVDSVNVSQYTIGPQRLTDAQSAA